MSINKYYLFIVLSILAFTPFISKASTLSLSPSSGTYNVGSIFSVNILLNTGTEQIDGVGIHYLNYSPSILEVQDDNASLAGVQITPGTLMPVTQQNSVDAVNGRIDFSQVAITGTKFTGSGTLATVRFKALASGTANVTFNFTSGSTTDTNVASSGVDVLTSASGGSFTLVNPPPPTITNLSFSVSLEADTNQNNNVFNIYVYTVGTSTFVDQYLSKTPASGIINISSAAIAAGTYDIKITSLYYLSKKQSNVSLSSNAAITLPKLLSGNLNNDNIINEIDWSVMSPVWGTSSDPSDINKDGIVNEIDFSWMNKNWGISGN